MGPFFLQNFDQTEQIYFLIFSHNSVNNLNALCALYNEIYVACIKFSMVTTERWFLLKTDSGFLKI